MIEKQEASISGYSIYNPEAKLRRKINPLEEIYPALPCEKYDVIYADPPWDYGGKMQYDKSNIKSENIGFEKNVFISAADFKYPTLKLRELKQLNIKEISANDCILFMWTTGPQFANSIELGKAWGFENIKQLLLFGTNKCIIPDVILYHRPNLSLLLKKDDSQLRAGREMYGSWCLSTAENTAKNQI